MSETKIPEAEKSRTQESTLQLTRTLKYGMRGDDVKALQTALKKKGFACKADGVFSMETVNAVRRMQKARKLPQNGVVDGTDVNALLQ